MSTKIYANARFGLREDTFENWVTNNPVLEKGEPAVVRDGENGEWLKIGDGVTPFSSLPWKKGPKGDKGEQGVQGIQGEKGIDGKDGQDGINGKDGVSITKTEINQNGELVITQSDNTISNLGVVVGADGIQGAQGDKGEKGEKGDKGDSYILTDEDKEQISDMVEVPIADQIYDPTSTNAQSGKAVAEVLKIAKTQKESFSDGAVITVADNTEYTADTPINTLTIIYPETDFLCSINFTLADEGDIAITLPESKYIGDAPEFTNGETWELNIKNGVMVGGLVE